MRKITRGGRRRLALGGALVVMLATGSTAAWAAKPDRAPFTPGPTSLEPGQACAFPVEIAQAPGSNYSQTTFGNGRFVVTGSGRDRVTNLNTSESAVLRTSGKLTVTELANGDQRIHASGRTSSSSSKGTRARSVRSEPTERSTTSWDTSTRHWTRTRASR